MKGAAPYRRYTMDDLRQLAELEQQALEYYKDGDYSGVVCMLVKAFEGSGLCTTIVPRDKSYEVYVAASPGRTEQAVVRSTPSTSSAVVRLIGDPPIVVRVYKVGGLQRTFDALVGSNIPTYHVSIGSELVGQPCTITAAVATVQACFE